MAGSILSMSKNKKSIVVVCGVAVAAATYLLLSRTSSKKGKKDVPNCDDGEVDVQEEKKGEMTPQAEEDDGDIPPSEGKSEEIVSGIAATTPNKSKRHSSNKIKNGTFDAPSIGGDSSTTPIRNAPESGDENQQNVSNRRPTTTQTRETPVDDAAVSMAATMAAEEALASAAAIAATKAAKNKRRKNGRKNKTRGTAQKAAAKEIQDFKKSQGGKK